ncbi:MAG TPA: hypothetical protein DEF44_15110, partial [Pseudomonas sp.]|nr:hypothetical protein [Pseudomonas sp.]
MHPGQGASESNGAFRACRAAGERCVDTVFIEGLEVDTVIGAYDWERGIRQCLQLDLTLGWDIRPAA